MKEYSINGYTNYRAGKLSRKHKPFVVVAYDEPYFVDVYNMIRDNETKKGTWTQEDQYWYDQFCKLNNRVIHEK